MLDELVVRNLGVLTEATVAPGPGLTVVTGETGAGKTLLVGALTALGGGLRPTLIGPDGDEVSISARFADDEDEVVVRSSLARGGRTRSYLDGSIAARKEVAAVVGEHVDVVAQHDGLALRRPAVARSLLDAALYREGKDALEAYRAAWDALQAAQRRLDEIGGDERALRRELELARHEAAEIAAADLEPGEDEALAAEVERLANAEALAVATTEAERAVEAAGDEVAGAIEAARRIGRLDPSAVVIAAAEGVGAELAELASSLRSYREGLVHDPEAVETAQNRQALIGDLRRKYGADVDEVIAYGARAEERAARLEALLDDAERIADEVAARTKALAQAAGDLTAARVRAADALSERAREHLRELGFTDPHLSFDMAGREPAAHGADGVTVSFASDARLDPGPVATTASGGELSRVVLALRLAGGVATTPVVVFDEVDAGVGGATALALGAKLAAVAERAQVLCVTHLPQVAAHADHHVVVERDGPGARARAVEGDDRVAELTRMLSGLPGSEQGREHAKELLARAGR